MVTRTHHSNADLFVESMLPSNGIACDIGASDGIFASNTLIFERKGWRVICVEANPELAYSLKQNRKEWVSCACGSEFNKMLFHQFGDFPYASGSGFHPELSEFKETSSFDVWVRTLNSILEARYIARLDLLTIDVEGHELEVLKGFDMERWHPKIIIIEENGVSLEKYMAACGYRRLRKMLYDVVYERIE